jgi:hypothetical protein
MTLGAAERLGGATGPCLVGKDNGHAQDLTELRKFHMALFAISDPATKIMGASGMGIFFSGDLHALGLVDAFYNRQIRASKTLFEEVERLLKTEEDIIGELTVERMKLAYIRAMKSKRANLAIFLMSAWLVAALISYSVHLATQC